MILESKNDINLEEVTQRVRDIINPHFAFNIEGRISVRSDVAQFKYQDDSSVWAQAKGKMPHYMELYWDDEWICDFTEKSSGAELLRDFLKGFTEKYEEGKVSLNTKGELEEAGVDRAKQIDKEIKALDEADTFSEEERVSNDAMKEMLEDKKDKIKKAKDKMGI